MPRPLRVLKGADYFPGSCPLYIGRAMEHFEFPFHQHDFVELVYVAEGQGFHHLEERIVEIGAGELLVIPVGVAHVLRPKSPETGRNRLIAFNCVCANAWLRSLLTVVAEPDVAEFIATIAGEHAEPFSLRDVDGTLADLYAAMDREFARGERRSQTLLAGLLLQLLAQIHRLRRGPGDGNNGNNGEGRGAAVRDGLFGDVLRHVERTCGQDMTLAQLADRFRLSERQLQRLFRKHTDRTFRDCLLDARIRLACRLLRDTDDKIGAVASASGYKDANAFIAVFGKRMGMSPGSYRKEFRTFATL